MIPLIVIAGPTAVGKTDFSIWLAEQLKTEIISADSMQVYQYMNIGTAKATLEQQARIKHHLLDIVAPDQDFSVADYRVLFDRSVALLAATGKIPVIVGGTGLYIRACLRSFLFDDPGTDWEYRNFLKEEAQVKGFAYLYQRLQTVDPLAASRIHANDLRRVIRALEVYQTTGQPISELQAQSKPDSIYHPIYIFLDRERAELYQRIETRVDMMLKAGFITEVETLLARGYSAGLKPMQSLGYRQIIQFLQGEIDWEQAVTLMKQQTRNYAKRQLTWFRKEPVDYWLNISNRKQEFFGEILHYIEGRLKLMSNKI